jgi:hypothetical protein
MRVSIISANDTQLWEHHASRNACGGATSAAYRENGIQDHVIAALIAALAEARRQLGRVAPQVADAVSDIRATAPEIDGHVPVAARRHHYPRREPLVEAAVTPMRATAPEGLEV